LFLRLGELFKKLKIYKSLLTSILSSNGGEEETPSPLWGAHTV
jgi:hypothetical protein